MWVWKAPSEGTGDGGKPRRGSLGWDDRSGCLIQDVHFIGCLLSGVIRSKIVSVQLDHPVYGDLIVISGILWICLADAAMHVFACFRQACIFWDNLAIISGPSPYYQKWIFVLKSWFQGGHFECCELVKRNNFFLVIKGPVNFLFWKETEIWWPTPRTYIGENLKKQHISHI